MNNFVFCPDHGLEHCGRCSCDHRRTNNQRIESDLGDLGSEFNIDFDVDVGYNPFLNRIRRRANFMMLSGCRADALLAFSKSEPFIVKVPGTRKSTSAGDMRITTV